MALHRALTWTPELGAAVLGHIKPPAGETLTMAARRIGKPHETVRRWVSIGLKQPEGEPIHAWALEVEATLLDDLASLNRGLRSSRDIMVTKLEMMCTKQIPFDEKVFRALTNRLQWEAERRIPEMTPKAIITKVDQALARDLDRMVELLQEALSDPAWSEVVEVLPSVFQKIRAER